MNQWACLWAISTAACATDSLDSATAYVIKNDDACIGVGCPGNSPIYAALGIWELSESPLQPHNKRGFWLDTNNIVKDGNKVFGFTVVGAVPQALGGMIYSGFLNTMFRIKHESGVQYDLKIDDYMTTGYYTNPLPGNPVPFPAYKLRYRKVGENDRWRDLCPYADPFDDGITFGTWGYFWKGDRIDPIRGLYTAHDDDVDSWFNVSCAGEGTGKVPRTGASGAILPWTTPAMRQASSDMFTARYCKDSYKRYTSQGMDIEWEDKTGSKKLSDDPKVEAIWDGNGAICLNPENMRVPQTIDCVLDRCDDLVSDWKMHGEVISAIP